MKIFKLLFVILLIFFLSCNNVLKIGFTLQLMIITIQYESTMVILGIYTCADFCTNTQFIKNVWQDNR